MSETLVDDLRRLIADWRERARRVRPLDSAPITSEKRARIAEWMFYTNRANELASVLASHAGPVAQPEGEGQ